MDWQHNCPRSRDLACKNSGRSVMNYRITNFDFKVEAIHIYRIWTGAGKTPVVLNRKRSPFRCGAIAKLHHALVHIIANQAGETQSVSSSSPTPLITTPFSALITFLAVITPSALIAFLAVSTPTTSSSAPPVPVDFRVAIWTP